MTKKDYIQIAVLLKDARDPLSWGFDHLINQLTESFADVLAEDNPQFDRARFLEAAGVD
jgi:hypothetical protein